MGPTSTATGPKSREAATEIGALYLRFDRSDLFKTD